MLRIIASNTPTKFIKGTTDTDDFNLDITETPIATGGTQNTVTNKDASITPRTNAGVINNFRLRALKNSLLNARALTLTNNSAAICDIDASGNVALKNGVASGNVSFEASVQGVGKRSYSRMITNSTGVVTTVSYNVAGSLAKHIVDSAAALIAGKTPTEAVRAAFNADGSRNTNAWCDSLDFSAHGRNIYKDCPLVSPRHVVTCHHSPREVGQLITFTNKAGISETRTIIAVSNKLGEDLNVVLLDQAVTVTTPFRILPTNYATKLPNLTQNYTADLPVLMRQNVREVENDWFAQYVKMNLTYADQVAKLDTFNAGTFNGWSSKLAGGDSGSPAFLVISNQPVLLGVTYRPSFSGDWLSHPTLNSQIVSAMRSLASAVGDNTAYDFSYINLAGFTTY